MERLIPFLDLRRQMDPIRGEIDAAVARVLDSGRFILGREVEAFEREWAAYCGAAHAVGVGSGTDALCLALRGAGIGRGDEVVVPAFTAIATVSAVEQAGATPVLADVDPVRRTLDPARTEAVLSARTRALIPVHLYGMPAEMDRFSALAKRFNLFLVEDCAQAAGSQFRGRRVGGWGHAAAFSFYPTKNLGALGDGGAVVTDDPALADRIRRLRQYGWDAGRVSEQSGWNSRLDEMQAAVLRVKLPYLDAWRVERQALAARYRGGLAEAGLSLPQECAGADPVFHLFVVRHARRDDLRRELRTRGVETSVHYPVPIHLQPVFKGLGYRSGDFPVAERLADEVLSLPFFIGLREGECAQIVEALQAGLTAPR